MKKLRSLFASAVLACLLCVPTSAGIMEIGVAEPAPTPTPAAATAADGIMSTDIISTGVMTTGIISTGVTSPDPVTQAALILLQSLLARL